MSDVSTMPNIPVEIALLINEQSRLMDKEKIKKHKMNMPEIDSLKDKVVDLCCSWS